MELPIYTGYHPCGDFRQSVRRSISPAHLLAEESLEDHALLCPGLYRSCRYHFRDIKSNYLHTTYKNLGPRCGGCLQKPEIGCNRWGILMAVSLFLLPPE